MSENAVAAPPPVPADPAVRRLSRRLRVLLTVVICAVLAGGLLYALRDNDPATGKVKVFAAQDRVPMRPLTGRTLQEAPFDLASLRGSVVVLNVWGSWCGPCRAEARALDRVALATAPEGVKFVGVNRADNVASAKAYEREFDVTYPSVQATDDTGPLLALRGLLPVQPPATMVIDRQGRVAATVAGGVTEPMLRAVLEPVIAEAP